MGDHHADKKAGNRFQIVLYAILILFVLCIYWIDRSHENASSATKATPSPAARITPVSSPTPLPFFSVDGLCAGLEKEGFVIVSAQDDTVCLRDPILGHRIRLSIKKNEDRISSVRYTVPLSVPNGNTESFRPFAESQQRDIYEEETDLFYKLLSGIVSAADPFIGGNAVPMISEWSINAFKTRGTGKPYHGKVKGLELSAVYSGDNDGTLQITLDLV